MARRKDSDELDLTPFIGLFAMLVVLLLLTASWSKLYSFKTKFSNSVQSASTPPPPDDEPKKKEIQLLIKVFQDQIIFLEQGKVDKRLVYEMIQKSKIESQVKGWIEEFGGDKQVTLKSQDKLPYGLLIDAYDMIFGLGMERIAISTESMGQP